MIPSIDYLTLVIAGAILLAGASNMLEADNRPDRIVGFLLAFSGLFLFIVGSVRAFISALNI